MKVAARDRRWFCSWRSMMVLLLEIDDVVALGDRCRWRSTPLEKMEIDGEDGDFTGKKDEGLRGGNRGVDEEVEWWVGVGGWWARFGRVRSEIRQVVNQVKSGRRKMRRLGNNLSWRIINPFEFGDPEKEEAPTSLHKVGEGSCSSVNGGGEKGDLLEMVS
ncbi:hypothetical protein L6452_18697 [Arctium lappa]|uniref:Uncharacterized protein n=1 Tax=Arctium lappa TaxID=4217 RepID=A0ACB9C6T0_ARCLA|nr:hypothetical protein L6452_18697 [Arctium lappa]